MDIRLSNYEGSLPWQQVIRMRCPRCHHNSRLEPLAETDDFKMLVNQPYGYMAGAGLRFCPDESCAQLVFVVYRLEADWTGNRLVYAAPAETLDFDSTDLPENVLTTIEEAARCYAAGCYVAAAIMIRKALEEVCHDKSVMGDNLKDRLSKLGSAVAVPPALVDGLDDLRLLGNDGAHVELKDFNQVGKTEVEVGFQIAKELLKTVYQYDSLIGRLAALKKTAQTDEAPNAEEPAATVEAADAQQ